MDNSRYPEYIQRTQIEEKQIPLSRNINDSINFSQNSQQNMRYSGLRNSRPSLTFTYTHFENKTLK